MAKTKRIVFKARGAGGKVRWRWFVPKNPKFLYTPAQVKDIKKLIRKQTLEEVLEEVKSQCGCGVESKYCSHYELRKWLEQELKKVSE